MNGNYKVIKAPDASRSIFYKLLNRVVIAMNMRQSLTGTKEEVLTKAARMNRKRSYSIIPSDGKANYTDHLIGGQYHCVETNIRKTRQQRAVLFVFVGGMILGSDKGDVDLPSNFCVMASITIFQRSRERPPRSISAETASAPLIW